MKRILVSACLLGINCKYDGRNNLDENLFSLLEREDVKVFFACPEQLGGMTTPREPAEIVGGDGFDVLKGKARVLTKSGIDVTENFIKGAREFLRIAKMLKVDFVVLKSKSPSCGSKFTYDGSFSKKLRRGCGVTAAILKEGGIKVYNERELKGNLNID
ncbi:MAG: DUF523 domain-containing protein [Candidatus Odinarchaeota archaeon]|nr:DUF523 domain-containing protein [Candidatus Odinarchaeota archaeon]